MRKATVVLIAALALVVGGQPQAQPVPVTPLPAPAFQSTDFQPVFDYADRARNTAEWEAMIGHGRFLLAANWEAQVDAQIDARVAAVGASDHFNSVIEYRDYLRKELLLQKNAAYTSWEQAADAEIEIQRDAFTRALSTASANASAQNGASQLQSAGSGDRSEQEFAALQEYWENQYQQEVDSGLQQYQTSFQTLQQDYAKFLSELDQSEANFAQNLKQIESYEAVVRNGIEQSVNGLEQNLATNQLFYEETCDSNNVCRTDPATLNPAGLQLQTLIASIRADLAADAPLSTLAATMTNYLETRQTDTLAQVTKWKNRSTGKSDWSSPRMSLEKRCVERGHFGICTKEEDPLNDWQISAVRTFLDNRGSSDLQTKLQAVVPKTIQSINSSGTNLRGYSSAGWRTPLEINSAGHNESYTSHGDKAFEYDSGIVCGPKCLTWITAREEFVEVTVNYTWFDSNADHNRTVWQGYADNLAPLLLEWRNELLPAIENWESQTAAYESNYAAWQAEAATKRAQAAAAYQSSVSEIEANRNRWITQMQSQYREQSAQWRSIHAQLETRSAKAENGANGLAANLSQESESVLQQLFNTPTPAVHTTAATKPAAFRNDANFLSRGATLKPQTDTLKRTLGAFQKSILGSKNLAVSRAYDDQAMRRHKQALGQLQSVVDAQNGFIHQMRNLPQSVIDIDDSLGDKNRRLRDLQSEDEPNANAIADLKAEIKELQAQRAQALADDLKNHQDESFQSYYDENGNLIMKRDIASGEARLRKGGNAENEADYESVDQEQRISIPPPDAVKLVKGGDLFEQWDSGELDKAFRQNMRDFDEKFQKHVEYAAEVMQEANSVAMDSEAAFSEHARQLVEEAKKPKKLAEQVFRSMLGGMDIGASLQSVMQGEIRQQLAPAFAKAFNIPAQLAASLLGGAIAGDLNVGETFENYVKGEMRNNIASAFAKATGWPSGFVSGLMGEDGFDFSEGNMRAAAQSYAEDQILEHIETHTGIEGLAGILKSTVVADYKKKQAKKAAGKLKTEDYLTGGATYAWRNAEHNPNLAAAVQVAEVVATSAASSTGMGVAAVAGYYAAKSAYSSHLKGESADASLKNALAGGVSSVINNYAGKVGVNVNLAYDEKNGFGGTLSASIPLGGAKSPFKIGASLSFQEGQGVTGGGLNASFSGSDGKGLKAGLNFDKKGNFSGGSVGASYSQEQGFGASVGVNFGARGEFKNVNAEVTYTDTRKYEKVGQTGNHVAGLGLTYHADGARDFNMINRVGAKDEYGIGINSVNAGSTLNFRYDPDGKYRGHEENINLDFGFQTQGDKEKAMRNRLAKIGDLLKDPRLSPDQRRELEDEHARLDQRQSREDRGRATERYLGRLLANDQITREEYNELKKDPKKFHSSKYARLQATGDAARSRDGLFAKIGGAIGDAAKWLVGDYSDADGYLDPETGEYVARTCFVAGTLVRVHPEANGAFEENGNWYKRIEEIRAGDLVLSWNEESGEVGWNSVAETFVRDTKQIYELTYSDGTRIQTTWNHKFHVRGKGWTEARNLEIGDQSSTSNSQAEAAGATQESGPIQLDSEGIRIANIRISRVTERVFNFSVDNTHTYFVGVSNVLVHNKGYGSAIKTFMDSIPLFNALNDGLKGSTEVVKAANACSNLDVSENYECTKKHFEKAKKHYKKMGTGAAKTLIPGSKSPAANALIDTAKDTAEDAILGEYSGEATIMHGLKNLINNLIGVKTEKHLSPSAKPVADRIADEITGAAESKVLSEIQKKKDNTLYKAARQVLDPVIEKQERETTQFKALQKLLKNMEREARKEQEELDLFNKLFNIK